MELSEISLALEAHIKAPTARVALLSDNGAVDESTLLATRDGYLRLAVAIVRVVIESEQPSFEGSLWTAAINDAFHSFPTFHEVAIVGSELYDTHQALLAALDARLADRVPAWKLDPDFEDPGHLT